jgi:hypothetical protein
MRRCGLKLVPVNAPKVEYEVPSVQHYRQVAPATLPGSLATAFRSTFSSDPRQAQHTNPGL